MNRRWMMACAALLLAFMMAMLTLTPKAQAAMPSGAQLAPEAQAMALIEAESGALITGRNEDLPLPMASTTKIMTALVVLENCALDDLVSAPGEAVGVEGSSIYLQRGEKLTVRDLLYGLMLASGNDAAVALAVHAGGSVGAFVDMMNERALSLGLEKTRFVTPNGLHAEGHQTTARELCAIAREALKLPEFRRIVSTEYYRAQSGNVPRTFKNKNALLWDYEGAFGVKTGYTQAAGRCLVFGAERGGMTVIGCVLNCRPMFETASTLMDFAFENYTVQTVIGAGSACIETKIAGGGEKVLEVGPKRSIIVLMQKGGGRSLRVSAELYEGLRAPVLRGQTVGFLRVFEGDTLIDEVELTALEAVPSRDYGFWWRLVTAVFAS